MSSVCGWGHTNRNSACGGCGFIPKSVTRQACEGGEKMAGRLPVRRTEMRGGRWRGVGGGVVDRTRGIVLEWVDRGGGVKKKGNGRD